MIKPDGVQRGLVGEIVKRFEQRGYSLKALKLFQASEELLREHYCDLVEKKFFPDLLAYMLSGPVTCMVWEGENAVKMGRQMLGATNPQDSLPGTIRGDFSIVVGRNICHGSDSPENAEKEIALWFKDGEVCVGHCSKPQRRAPMAPARPALTCHSTIGAPSGVRLGRPFERVDLRVRRDCLGRPCHPRLLAR